MRLASALLLFSTVLQAQLPVRYVLAGRVVVTDPSPDRRFDLGLTFEPEFRSRFESAFHGQALELGPERMLGAEERVVVILPRVTAARVTHMVQAGSIHTFNAFVVGDVTALDPWTGARLFAATRMVEGEIQLGNSALGGADAAIRESFEKAYKRWIDSTLDELKRKLAPFVLNAPTVAAPESARREPGGIWPYGAVRGVRTGALLRSDNGRLARVTHVSAKFSFIRDISDLERRIPAGEQYSLTVVEKPTERPEPRVNLAWLGAAPAPPDGLQAASLDQDAMVGLFTDYISKTGGLRILPPEFEGAAMTAEVSKLQEQVARYSKLAQKGFLSVHAESLARLTREDPEHRIEVGILERYMGTRTVGNGSTEQYFRLTLGAAICTRAGSEASALYPLQHVIQHTEELARVTKKGVREIDPADAWFTLLRNASIRLSAKIVQEMGSAGNEGGPQLRQGLVGADRTVQWDGPPPSAGTPLEWLRPEGEVRTGEGESLGRFDLLMQPSQGFLNARVLAGEKLEVGDLLRFQSARATETIAGLEVEIPERPAWTIEPAWLARIAEDNLSRVLGVRLVTAPTGSQLEARLVLNVTALKAEAVPNGEQFTGQWRLRLSPGSFKSGIQNDARIGLESGRTPLDPPDVPGWSLRYATESLHKLSDLARTKGAKEALAASSRMN